MFAALIAALGFMTGIKLIYQSGFAIWNAVMGLCTGLLKKTPQNFSSEAWEFVRDTLYPWSLGIGITVMNLFCIIALYKAVSNLKENLTSELIIEAFIKIVVLNILLIKGMDFIVSVFNMSSALAGDILVLSGNIPFIATEEDAGSILFMFIFALVYFFVALVCSILILITIYGRYLNLYILTVCFPLAVPSIIAGRGVDATAYAWLRHFLLRCVEIVVIAMAMAIGGKVISGINIFTESMFAGFFDGFVQSLNSMVYMILMTATVKSAASFTSKTFAL